MLHRHALGSRNVQHRLHHVGAQHVGFVGPRPSALGLRLQLRELIPKAVGGVPIFKGLQPRLGGCLLVGSSKKSVFFTCDLRESLELVVDVGDVVVIRLHLSKQFQTAVERFKLFLFELLVSVLPNRCGFTEFGSIRLSVRLLGLQTVESIQLIQGRLVTLGILLGRLLRCRGLYVVFRLRGLSWLGWLGRSQRLVCALNRFR